MRSFTQPNTASVVARRHGLLGRAALCVLLASSGLSSEVSAQTVVGTVREAGSGRPLSTAWVALIDQSGVRAAATVAGPDGAFALQAVSGGMYQLQTRLLGYDEVISEPFELARGTLVQRDLLVSVRAFQLAGIEVSAAKSCRSLSAAGPELAAVWDEARTALEIIAWTSEAEALVYDVVEYQRSLETSTLQVRQNAEDVRRGAYTGSPYVSVPPDTLREHGYVRRSVGRETAWEYWAPDAAVLLSDSFLSTHCFDFHPDSDDERLGIRFEPTVGRDLPEIEGVFWLSRSSAELRALEFRYVNLPSDHPDSPHLGGEVEFQHLATGGWIVNDWRIRIPNVVLRLRAAGVERVIDSVLERGARVLRVATRDGETLADAVGATLTGTISMLGARTPIPGAVIEIVHTGFRAVAGAAGGYRMTDLPPGTFEVRISHPWLEALGLDPVRSSAVLEAGIATRLPVDVDVAGAVASFCPSIPDARVVYGTIRDPASDQPIGRATVSAEMASTPSTDLTGPSGRWAVCVDAALDSVPLALFAPSGEERLRTWAALTDDPLVEVSLEAAASDFTFEERSPELEEEEPAETLLAGVVYEEDSQTPIADAQLVLRSADGTPVRVAESGSRGEFALPTLSNAYRFLTVQKIGYIDQTLAGNLRSGADSTEGLRIYLRRAPVRLEGVDVRVDRPDMTVQIRTSQLEERGFFERQEAGWGDFFGPELIDQRQPTYFSDLIIRLPRVRIANGVLVFDGRSGVCRPNIWIDGVLAIWGATTAGVGTGGALIDIDDRISAADVMGVEVYRTLAGTPLQYSIPNAACGTVLIWTG